jgi:hypothetical protein
VADLAEYHGFGPGRPGLALGYGLIEHDRIDEGLRVLGEVL